MDLSTISKKLELYEYADIFEFNNDMNLVWSNAKRLNEPGSKIFKHAGYLSRAWNRRFLKVSIDPAVGMLWSEETRPSWLKKSPRVRERDAGSRQMITSNLNSNSIDELSKLSGISRTDMLNKNSWSALHSLNPQHHKINMAVLEQGSVNQTNELKAGDNSISTRRTPSQALTTTVSKIDAEFFRASNKKENSKSYKDNKTNGELNHKALSSSGDVNNSPQLPFQRVEIKSRNGCSTNEDIERDCQNGSLSNFLEKDISEVAVPELKGSLGMDKPERRQKRKKRDWPAPNYNPKGKPLASQKNCSTHTSKTTSVMTVDDIFDMSLGQLHNLREELDLKWHHEISKAELQRRLRAYLERKEIESFEKSPNAIHWVPPSHIPKPSNLLGTSNEEVRNSDDNFQKSIQSNRVYNARNMAVDPLIRDWTDSKPSLKVGQKVSEFKTNVIHNCLSISSPLSTSFKLSECSVAKVQLNSNKLRFSEWLSNWQDKLSASFTKKLEGLREDNDTLRQEIKRIDEKINVQPKKILSDIQEDIKQLHDHIANLETKILSSNNLKDTSSLTTNINKLSKIVQDYKKHFSESYKATKVLSTIGNDWIEIKEKLCTVQPDTNNANCSIPKNICTHMKTLTSLDKKILATVETVNAKFEIRSKDETSLKAGISDLNKTLESFNDEAANLKGENWKVPASLSNQIESLIESQKKTSVLMEKLLNRVQIMSPQHQKQVSLSLENKQHQSSNENHPKLHSRKQVKNTPIHPISPAAKPNHRSYIKEKDRIATQTKDSDISLKLNAIRMDLGLYASGDKEMTLFSFSNKPISNGYSGIVADKESAWIQLDKESIVWNDMVQRSSTPTRQYWTKDGVTIHKQISKEIRVCPRPNKLSVKPFPPEPPGFFSKLLVGKYYVHAHQIMTFNKFGERRKLCTKLLIEKLRKTYGDAYNPKYNRSLSNCKPIGHNAPVSQLILSPPLLSPEKQACGENEKLWGTIAPTLQQPHQARRMLNSMTPTPVPFTSTPPLPRQLNHCQLQWPQMWSNRPMFSPLQGWPSAQTVSHSQIEADNSVLLRK